MSVPPPALDSNVDRSQRSVFVGNIPYEATEEKLKEIFSEIGPVVSFKLVYDRDNGKPKGYGFCEFRDPQEALSAMRNLNGYEIGGRSLRVDYACTEKSRMEMMMLNSGTGGVTLGSGGVTLPLDTSNPYGANVDPTDAPEAISKAVSSLAPEDMFKLMSQMKLCIESNPAEAREMLSKNPQLAYALLQAQVVMRIVEPELALTMLHKTPHKPFQPPPAAPMLAGGHMSRAAPPASQSHYGQPQPMPFRPSSDFGPPLPPSHQQHSAPGRDYPPPVTASMPPTRDPRSRDPRGQARGGSGSSNSAQPLPPQLIGADPEKAELIMQVLKLTDEQIALLPHDQRMSILQLKKQVDQMNK